MFFLKFSPLHLLGKLRKPIGDQQGCVDEPANAVSQACLFSAWKAAAGGAHAHVPAHLCCLVQLLHDLHLLLGGGKVLLEASALSSAKLELENFLQIFSIGTIASTKNKRGIGFHEI